MLASYLSPSRLGVTGSVEFALHKLWGSCPRRKNKPCLGAVPGWSFAAQRPMFSAAALQGLLGKELEQKQG